LLATASNPLANVRIDGSISIPVISGSTVVVAGTLDVYGTLSVASAITLKATSNTSVAVHSTGTLTGPGTLSLNGSAIGYGLTLLSGTLNINNLNIVVGTGDPN